MAIACCVALMGTATAQSTNGTQPPTKKYRSSSGSGKIFETPEAACQDSVAGLAKTGNKQTLVKVKPGTTEWSDTCVLKPADGKVWDQTNAVQVLEKCPDGSDSRSSDNSGTIASQVCPCDPVKGCAVAPPKNDDCAAIDRRDDRCFPPKQDVKRSPEEAARMSSANQAKAKSQHGDEIAKYNAAKSDIDTEQAAENRVKHGPNATGFPGFSDADLCGDKDTKGRATDVNIGMLCGFDDGDFAAANAVAGYADKPKDCTWHHSEDLGRFVLLKNTNHAQAPHWGGRAIWKRAFNVPYPSHCKK